MRTCKNCGEYVSADFARVFGANDGEVYACPSCATMTAIMDVGLAGRDAFRPESTATI